MVPQRHPRHGHAGIRGCGLDCPYGVPLLSGGGSGRSGRFAAVEQSDWLLLAAWVMVMVYFYLACYHPATHFGVFLLPLVLGLIVAARFADPRPFPREPASKIWGVIHGTSILLATVTVLFGFAAGLMYLEQADRLKRKRPAPI